MRQDEAKRLMQWMLENPEDWHRMCSSTMEPVEPKGCAKYIQLMEQNEFYSMIAVILTNNSGELYRDHAIRKFVFSALVRKYDNDGMKQFPRDLKIALYAENL